MAVKTASRRCGMSLVSGTVKGIPASRILRFARTRRWAMVVAGTRNARAQRQRHLRFERECGMTTGEDQPQTIVRNLPVVEAWFVDDLTRKKLRVRFHLFFEP